jgi:tetratricopeptide (TPR) repeat protein
MSAEERWSQVSEILSRALDLPESDRRQFLAEEIRKEPSLRTEVFALFDELNEGDGLLQALSEASVEGPRPAAGATFGAYRILGELGEGGMGVVYLAERGDGQFHRRVAIKRVPSAAKGYEALRRVSDERQILSRLDHPNIARLLDAGIDASGIPYLVMEYVEGEPLTRYCRGRDLPVEERLRLFVKVCTAVAHAHQNLIVHRDLKPANILVTSAGEPKLLDFGIAKITTGSASDATRTVNRALTLDYASPEQVLGDAVTTASDVYSLGVVLYELLTEVKPYETGARSLSDAVRHVCEFVPPPPSQIASDARHHRLAGDLDAIVRKAMEKAPSERYPSVAELASEVLAHLEHRPVQARRPSFGYVARKFARRHRAGAAVSLAVLVLIASGGAAVLWQARVAERERGYAQERFEEVRRLANFVIFDLQDSLAKLPGSTDLRRRMVERSLEHLNSLARHAAEDEGLQLDLARAYIRLGDVLGKHNVANLGDRAGALSSYDEARELVRRVLARNPREADTRRALAGLLLSLHNGYQADRRELAGELLEQCMALWQGLVEEDPAHEDNLRGLASAHFSASIHFQADLGEHVSNMERALEMFQRLLQASPQDPDRKRNVALCHKYLHGVFGELDPPRAFRHALDAARLDSERLAAEPHDAQAKLDYSFDLGAVAHQHVSEQRYDQAISYFEQALALRRELWEADRANAFAANRLAYTLMRLGETHVLAGRPQDAAPLLAEAIDLAAKLPGQDQPSVFGMLARAYVAQGEVELASNRDPCPWYRFLADLRPKLEAGEGEIWPAPGRALRDRAFERLPACGR